MKITCTLTLNYNTKKQAKHVFESVHVDDTTFMESTQGNNRITTKIQTKTIPSMLHTIDDFLSCVRIAENIITKNNSSSKK